MHAVANFLPLAAFVLAYRLGGIYVATAVLMVASLIDAVSSYLKGSFIGRSSRRKGSKTRPKPLRVVAPSNGSSPTSPTMTIESPRLP